MHRVELALDEPFDRGVHRGHRRRARGVDDEVRPAQVEEVRDPARQAVAELARHRVLGRRRQPGLQARVQLRGDRRPRVRGQGREARRVPEPARELGERQAHRGQVVLLAGHRVAQHDGGPLGVQRPLGPAVVGERHARAGDAPLLRVVHRVGDRRGDRQMPSERVPLPVAHPAADLRVRALGRVRVRVVVEVRVPARRVDVGDRVAAPGDVVPEGAGVGGVGEDGAHADDGDGVLGGCAHGVLQVRR